MYGLLGPAAAPEKGNSLVCRRAGYRLTALPHFQLCRAPGEGRGNGHRTSFRLPASGVRLPGSLEARFRLKVSGAGAYGSGSPGA
ncbi:hypothetical protein SBA2_40039 [Acidobacteriia bacterium SbA2]|nr:hypothetical protein SBA2_40039 [Acidobacteriia bacterium SbA2]